MQKQEAESLRDQARVRVGALSERELQVAIGIADGLTPMAIAAQYQLSVKTVSTYRQRVLEKLELPSNSSLAIVIYVAGLVECPPLRK